MYVRDMPGCIGCPIRGDGSQRYVPDELVENAPVLIVGQNPGEDEEAQGKPFVGKTGQLMERTYLKAAGLQRGGVSLANALRCRWQNSNELPPLVKIQKVQLGLELPWEKEKCGIAESALLHCRKAHSRIPSGTRLIVTQGEYSLWSVSGLRSVSNWRGWLVPMKDSNSGWRTQVWTPRRFHIPVLVTVHLAALFRDSTLMLPTLMDWQKVKRIREGKWPSPFPSIQVESPQVWPRIAAFDTEFDPTTRVLQRYSLYDGRSSPWVVEASDVRQVAIPEGATVVMHNIEADMDHLNAILRGGAITAEDTMLMHAVLWSDLPHDLEFLGSLYAPINRWKHLSRTNPVAYSAGDAVGTWSAYQRLAGAMEADPQSAWIYRHSVFPLTPIIMEAERVGLALDQARVHQAITHFEARQEATTQEAQAYSGYPINLGSPEQVARWLYEVEKVGIKRRKKRGTR